MGRERSFPDDSHVRNSTHKSNKLGSPPTSAFSLLTFPVSSSYRRVVSFLPSSPHIIARALSLPAQLYRQGTTFVPWDASSTVAAGRARGTFGCRGTGRAYSHVPFVLLPMVRQILHLTTFLREPVLPQPGLFVSASHSIPKMWCFDGFKCNSQLSSPVFEKENSD